MCEPFEALMNDHIVHEKVSKTIRHYAEANGLQPVHALKRAKKNAQKTGYGKDDKEGIVLFKKTGFGIVMVFVQVPQEPVHHEFMCCPGDSLHDAEGANEYRYVYKPVHTSVL
jgi:hypothetical protein